MQVFLTGVQLGCGLRQFMAGARRARIADLSRTDLTAGNRETARAKQASRK